MKSFLGNFYRHLAIFTGHTGSVWRTEKSTRIQHSKGGSIVKRKKIEVFDFDFVAFKNRPTPGHFSFFYSNKTVYSTNKCLTIKYLFPGFELTTFWTSFIFHKHKTKAYALLSQKNNYTLFELSGLFLSFLRNLLWNLTEFEPGSSNVKINQSAHFTTTNAPVWYCLFR